MIILIEKLMKKKFVSQVNLNYNSFRTLKKKCKKIFKYSSLTYKNLIFLLSKLFFKSLAGCGGQTPHRAELLKVEGVETHVCAIVLRIGAKYVLLNTKQEKLTFFNDCFTILQTY